VSTSSKAMIAALGDAALIFEGAISAAPVDLVIPVSPRAEPLIDYALAWYREKQRLNILSISRQECMSAFGHGMTRQILIEQAGEVESYLDGGNRRISTASICRRLIALAILSHPLDGPERKARQPAERFQRLPRERTQAELEGLKRGNERRAEEARQRREAKAAARV
jgi:hypothetical protein